jgi:uncharacterized protein (TIGR02246 family)
MSWRQLMFSLVCTTASLAASGFAEEQDPAELQAALAQTAEQYVKAFADRDSAALANLFTEEAEYIDEDGTVFHGREAIEAELAASFVINGPGTLEIEFLSLRPIAAGVLVEDGISTFTPQGDGPKSQMRYAATHVKQDDGQWRIASVRELERGAQTPHDRLQDLAWLVGKWHEDVDDSIISSQWKWTEDGNVLISEYSVQQGGRNTSGTHRVGWDGERNQFRSWIFDATGGAAGGWWKVDEDDNWSVDLSGVDAEGVRISSTLIYTRDGADAMAISQVARARAGESLPDSTHRVVRQPPEPSEEQISDEQPLTPKTKPTTTSSSGPKTLTPKSKPATPKK